MKTTWEAINNLISISKKKVNQISNIKKPDGSLSTYPSEISNVLNKHFASVGHNLASKLPPSKHSFNEYLTNNRLPNSFNFEPLFSLISVPKFRPCPSTSLVACSLVLSKS